VLHARIIYEEHRLEFSPLSHLRSPVAVDIPCPIAQAGMSLCDVCDSEVVVWCQLLLELALRWNIFLAHLHQHQQ
jgi:hypothetical protein